jgi:hypothetical protein
MVGTLLPNEWAVSDQWLQLVFDCADGSALAELERQCRLYDMTNTGTIAGKVTQYLLPALPSLTSFGVWLFSRSLLTFFSTSLSAFLSISLDFFLHVSTAAPELRMALRTTLSSDVRGTGPLGGGLVPMNNMMTNNMMTGK